MECDICRRGHDAKRLPFLCTVDARNKIYECRMKHLQVLMETDGLRAQINDLLADSSEPSLDGLQATRSEQLMCEDRTNQIVSAADKLRDDIQAARDEIQARKSVLARRRSDFATMSDGLKERRLRQQKDLEKSIQMSRFRWSQSAEEMAQTRAFLCTEAASLYGLRRVPRKGNKGSPEYQISKVPIIDPMALNSLSPELITTSLGHVAHVVMLAAHYLSIRLPAELTLPHGDYPHPTILHLNHSYRHSSIPFPGTSGTTTPLGPGDDKSSRHIPRPRPLYTYKPLPQLLKDDPATYSHFLEGVTLLAYDIAWLCGSQGLLIGEKNPFDDVCQMGRNLYDLLIKPPTTASNGLSVPSINHTPDSQESNKTPSHNWIGRYSHGATYYHLGGSEGTEIIKSFKIPSPIKLADKLKKKLVGDAPAPDWEVLDDDAWKIEDIPTEDLVDSPQGKSKTAAKSSAADKTSKTSSGWTKVR